MPAPSSPVDICNLALDYLGQDSVIASITLPRTPIETIFSHHYDLMRQCLLRSYGFSFARKEAVLASTLGLTIDYSQGFLLPDDCLRLMRIGSALFHIRDYQIQDRTILVGNLFSSPVTIPPTPISLSIQYISDETIVKLFDPLFIQLLALELANKLAYKFNRSSEQQAEINKLLMQETQKCVGTTWQESKPRRIDISPAVRSRYIDSSFDISYNQIYWRNID